MNIRLSPQLTVELSLCCSLLCLALSRSKLFRLALGRIRLLRIVSWMYNKYIRSKITSAVVDHSSSQASGTLLIWGATLPSVKEARILHKHRLEHYASKKMLALDQDWRRKVKMGQWESRTKGRHYKGHLWGSKLRHARIFA